MPPRSNVSQRPASPSARHVRQLARRWPWACFRPRAHRGALLVDVGVVEIGLGQRAADRLGARAGASNAADSATIAAPAPSASRARFRSRFMQPLRRSRLDADPTPNAAAARRRRAAHADVTRRNEHFSAAQSYRQSESLGYCRAPIRRQSPQNSGERHKHATPSNVQRNCKALRGDASLRRDRTRSSAPGNLTSAVRVRTASVG